MNTTSGSEVDDPLQEARAYNQSIYFMVSMPYLLLGGLGFWVYRGYRSARQKALADWEAQSSIANRENHDVEP